MVNNLAATQDSAVAFQQIFWSKRRPILLIVFICAIGCGSPAPPSTRVAPRSPLRLKADSLVQIVDTCNEPTQFLVPFTVASKCVIIDIRKSCTCVSAGSDFVGKPLVENQEYELPVEILLGGKTDTSVKLNVVTDDGAETPLSFDVICKSEPKVIPSIIDCEYVDGASDQPSGRFSVQRTREKAGQPLEPIKKVCATQCLEVRLVDVEISERGATFSNQNRRGHVAVSETLWWEWRWTGTPTGITADKIEIAWRDRALPVTVVNFRIKSRPVLHGLVEDLWCGTIPPGAKWTHRLVIFPEPSVGEIESVTSDCPFATASIHRSGDHDLLHIDIEVHAPTEPGSFQGNLHVNFSNTRIKPATIKVRGIVATSNFR